MPNSSVSPIDRLRACSTRTSSRSDDCVWKLASLHSSSRLIPLLRNSPHTPITCTRPTMPANTTSISSITASWSSVRVCIELDHRLNSIGVLSELSARCARMGSRRSWSITIPRLYLRITTKRTSCTLRTSRSRPYWTFTTSNDRAVWCYLWVVRRQTISPWHCTDKASRSLELRRK